LNYLIDTNVLSELSKKTPNQDLVTFINALLKDNLYISVVTLGEIIKGIEKASDVLKKRQLADWYKEVRALFDGKIIDIDEGIISVWGKLVGSCSRTLPAFDSLIAATCIYSGSILLTRNEKDFDDIPNIVIQNPWKSAAASQ
jgi:predicted nucleic acid-binding protein